MKVSATRENLLAPLQSVIGVVERRQTMPVLANVLLVARGDKLTVTGTDLEVELVAAADVTVQQAGDVTVPGRKLLEIMRTLPEKANVTLTREAERVVRARRPQPLHALESAGERISGDRGDQRASRSFACGREHFRRLIDKTHFAMAQQDVRYYLNGTMLETDWQDAARGRDRWPSALAGARPSWPASAGERPAGHRAPQGHARTAADPRGRGRNRASIGSNHVRAQIGEVRFTSKLIDGKFPEYGRVIPAKPPRTMSAARDALRAGPAAHIDPVERKVPRRTADLCQQSADGPGAQSRAGRSRGPDRSQLQRRRAWRSASTSPTCSMRWPPSTSTPSRSR